MRYHWGMRTRWLALLVVGLLGCGGGGRAPTTPAPTAAPTPAPTRPTRPPAAAATEPAAVELAPPPAPPAPLSAAECAALVDHMLEVGLAEQAARDPRAPVPTAEQTAAIRAQLLGQLEPTCATLPRATWTCAMAATSRQAMVRCDEGA